MADGTSDKSNTVALLLCFFIGVLGVHRFYVGKIGTGVLQLVTIGGASSGRTSSRASRTTRRGATRCRALHGQGRHRGPRG